MSNDNFSESVREAAADLMSDFRKKIANGEGFDSDDFNDARSEACDRVAESCDDAEAIKSALNHYWSEVNGMSDYYQAEAYAVYMSASEDIGEYIDEDELTDLESTYDEYQSLISDCDEAAEAFSEDESDNTRQALAEATQAVADFYEDELTDDDREALGFPTFAEWEASAIAVATTTAKASTGNACRL